MHATMEEARRHEKENRKNSRQRLAVKTGSQQPPEEMCHKICGMQRMDTRTYATATRQEGGGVWRCNCLRPSHLGFVCLIICCCCGKCAWAREQERASVSCHNCVYVRMCMSSFGMTELHILCDDMNISESGLPTNHYSAAHRFKCVLVILWKQNSGLWQHCGRMHRMRRITARTDWRTD